MKKKDILINLNFDKKKKPSNKKEVENLIAGASKENITPPPGMPRAGYSLLTNNAQGVRTKLFARAIYIKSKNEDPIVVLQCDLLSGSFIVHHKVSELIAQKTDIRPSGLIMAGTHTHSAPGNYYSNDFYNNHASNSAGFDEQYFDFLTKQMAKAVIDAYTSANKKNQKAKIATGYSSVTDVTKNRSLGAYRNNKNIKDDIADVDAVNNKLFLIRIDVLSKNKYIPLAVISSFSIHPNLIAPLDKFYNADVFGFIERRLEYKIKEKYNLKEYPIHAALNFTHGDNDALYKDGVKDGFIEAKRLGIKIADEAFILFESLKRKTKNKVRVRSKAKELNLFKDNKINEVEICHPAVGMSQIAGATCRPLPIVYKLPYFAPNWPKKVKDDVCPCHKEKRVTLGRLQKLILPKAEFPHYAFLQVLQIDDSLLMFLPFEITYEIGSRMSRRVFKSISTLPRKNNLYKIDKEKIISVSTSNGYFGYVNTEEEYALQYYEGGSNMYGPQTGNFLAEHLKDLLENFKQENQKPLKQSFRLSVKSYYPTIKKFSGEREVIQEPTKYIGKKNEENMIYFRWKDVPICDIDYHKPLLKVEVSKDNKRWKLLELDSAPIDDSGYDISVHFLKKYDSNNMAFYEGRWYNYEIDDNLYYRFVIEERKELKKFIVVFN